LKQKFDDDKLLYGVDTTAAVVAAVACSIHIAVKKCKGSLMRARQSVYGSYNPFITEFRQNDTGRYQCL